MIKQHTTDFVKKKGSNLVLSNNDDYYQEVKRIREEDMRFKEMSDRIGHLERELNKLKQFLREKFFING